MNPRPLRRRDERRAAALFARYRQHGDLAARDALVEHYLPLAQSIANRYRHTPQPLEDLVQVANLALVKAVKAFDPERGLAFSSYAVPTIVGEIKRHFRDTAWALHLPRAMKERVLLVERAERSLATSIGRAPSVQDLARATSLSEEQVLDAMQARSAAQDTDSIEAAQQGDDEGPRPDTVGATDDALLRVEERAALRSALDHLPERDRTIIALRFGQDMTQSQIADEIGVSQMQVSRLLRRALAQMREFVEQSEV